MVITPSKFGLQFGNSRGKGIVLVLLGRIAGDDLAVWQALDPAAKFPPFVQLVVAPVLVDVGQNLIVQHDRSLLVVAGGEELNHLPPVELVLGIKEPLAIEI